MVSPTRETCGERYDRVCDGEDDDDDPQKDNANQAWQLWRQQAPEAR